MYKYQLRFENYDETIVAYSLCDALSKISHRGDNFEPPVLKCVTRSVDASTIGSYNGRLYLCDIRAVEGGQNLLTKEDMASLYGIRQYDVAIPQQWLENRARELAAYELVDSECEAYDLIRSGAIWCYQGKGYEFGGPYYLFAELVQMMRRLDHYKNPTTQENTNAIVR